jgi:hypothetical protein
MRPNDLPGRVAPSGQIRLIGRAWNLRAGFRESDAALVSFRLLRFQAFEKPETLELTSREPNPQPTTGPTKSQEIRISVR